MITALQVFARKSKIIATVVAIEELVTANGYDITSEDIVIKSGALLKVKSTASGSIKVNLAGEGTAITLAADDVNEANIHVTKVYSTSNGTDAAMEGKFFLWQ